MRIHYLSVCSTSHHPHANTRNTRKCNEALYQLKWSAHAYSTPVSESYNDSLLYDSSVLTPGSESFTLRVRCRGKMHKYTVQMVPNVLFSKTALVQQSITLAPCDWGCLVTRWIKHWTMCLKVPGSSPSRQQDLSFSSGWT